MTGSRGWKIAAKYRDQVGIARLTPAERRVLLMLVDGHTHESIGHQLDTVKVHVSRICLKLSVNSSRDLVCWYYKTYWVPGPLLSNSLTVTAVPPELLDLVAPTGEGPRCTGPDIFRRATEKDEAGWDAGMAGPKGW